MRKVYLLLIFAFLNILYLNAQEIFNEGFEDSFSSSGWLHEKDAGNSYGWRILKSSTHCINAPHAGEKFVEFESYFTTAGKGAMLISPTVKVPDKLFRLDFYSVVSGRSNGLHVDLSMDGGATWTEDVLSIEKTAKETQWTRHNVDISEYLPCENLKIRFRAISSCGSGKCNIALDDVRIYKPQDMVYQSGTTVQNNTSVVAIGSQDAEVIGVKINCKGALLPLSVNGLTFDLSSSTQISDITKAKVYYTGSASVFKTDHLYSEVSNIATGIALSGNQELVEGDNYFWLAFDISADAADGNVIDAGCNKIKIGSDEKVPGMVNPDGNRVLKNMVLMSKGTKNIKVNKTVVFYDDGGPLGNYSKQFDGVVIFEPIDDSHKVQIDFSKFKTGSLHTLTIYDGNSTAAEKIDVYSGSTSLGLIKSTSDDGCLTVKFHVGYSEGQEGWEAEVSNYQPQSMTYVSSNAFQDNLDALSPGDVKNELIGCCVSTQGLLSPLTAKSLLLSFSGTTNLADIEKVTLFYGKETKNFNSSGNIKVAEITDLQNEQLTIDFSRPLVTGKNYFWVAVDIAASAGHTNIVDARITKVNISQSDYMPEKSNPEGSRQILRIYQMEKDKEIITSGGLFYDNGGASGNYSGSFDGCMIFKPLNPKNKIRMSFSMLDIKEGWNASEDYLIIYDGPDKNAPELGKFYGQTLPPVLTSTASDGSLCIYFKANSWSNAKGWEAKISEYIPKDMEFIGSEIIPFSDEGVCKGAMDQPIIGLKLNVEGSLKPLSCQQIKIDTKGTQGINKIKLYSTGKKDLFNNDNLVGEKIVEGESVTFDVDQTFLEGINYYWVAYDVSPDANEGDRLKADCSELVISGIKYSNTDAQLAGREVINYVNMPVTTNNVVVVNDEILFLDDGGKENPHGKDVKGSIVFKPADPSKKVKVEFSEFELQNYGVDFYVFNGQETNGSNTIANLKGSDIPDPVKSTSADGALRFYFKSASMFTQKPGWVSRVYCYEPRSLFLERAVAIQKERKFLRPEAKDQVILGVELNIAGEQDELNVQKLTFSTEGCTKSTDISSAKLYYTSNDEEFSTDEKIGEVKAPFGDFTFELDKTIKAEGTYHFWLCFDIAVDAKPGDIVDAILKSITVDGQTVTVEKGNPIGKRVIRKALNGAYSISNDLSVDADFISFSEAAEALNVLGITGDVTFNVADGEYEDAFVLNEVTGSSVDNQIVFKSVSGNRNKVVVKYFGKPKAPSLMILDGADYVTFEGMTFKNTGVTYGRIVEIYNEANCNKFINNVFEGVEASDYDSDHYKTIIYGGGYDCKSLDNNNEFRGNHFKEGNIAVYLKGVNAISEFETGLILANNTFENQYSKSVYLNCQDHLVIEGNSFIQSDNKGDFKAIDVFQSHKDVKVVANKFNLNCGSNKCTGILLRNFNSVDESKTIVFNNLVYVKSGNFSYGVHLSDIDFIDLLHNTVKIDGSGTSSKGLYIEKGRSSVIDHLRIINNIFSIYTGGYAIWSKAEGTNTIISNNDYYSDNTAEHFIKYGAIEVNSLEAFQTAFPADANSISVDPGFNSETDLHISGTNLRFGRPVENVMEDFDGELRNAATPYIGADEIPDATFEGGYPKFEEVTAVSADMLVKSNETGEVYFLLLPKGAELPSKAQIKAGKDANDQEPLKKGNIAIEANREGKTSITGLTEKTAYDVVLVEEKANGGFSGILRLCLATLDITAPEFINETPELVQVSDQDALFKAEINEPGFIYYALCDNSVETLSVEYVMNGNNSIAFGKINADKENEIPCNQLNAATNYNLFVVAQDDQPNANTQSNVAKISFKTLNSIGVSNFVAQAVQGSRINLAWEQPSQAQNVLVVYSTDNNFGRPQTGESYQAGDLLGDGGTVLYSGKGKSFNHTGIESGHTYYYRIYTYSKDREYSQYVEDYAVLKYDKWTVLVYLDGDNNLEGNAIKDINEMESVDLPENVNVIVQMDRSPSEDYSNGNWTETRRYKIVHDDDVKNISSTWLDEASPLGELNMGHPETLSDFVEWGMKSFPSEKTMLILWDHGGGWRAEQEDNSFTLTKGVCWDDTDGGDFLEMREVASALDVVKNNTNKAVNVLGFDVCLAGMVEVAYQVKDVVADNMVFSQALVPGTGWDYDAWLNVLAANPEISSEELSMAAVNTYRENYMGRSHVTMSALDVSKLGAVKNALDQFVITYSNAAVEPAIVNAAFNKGALLDSRENYIDLGLFADYCSKYLLNNQTKAAAADVLAKINDAIVVTGNTGVFDECKGLNIYFHKFEDYEWEDYRAPYCDFADESNWKSFVQNYDNDGMPPVFIDGYPKAQNISSNVFDLVVKTSKTGKGYFVVLDNEAGIPSVNQVKAGKDARNQILDNNKKGVINFTRYEMASQAVSGLTESTEYDIYFVLEDQMGQTSSEVKKFEVTTLDRKVATFERLLLPNNAFWKGADYSGSFVDGGFVFPNNYDPSVWSGFGYSNCTDNTGTGIYGEFTASAGGGAENSKNYGVSYVRGTFVRVAIEDAGEGVPVSGLYVTNNDYAVSSMESSDNFGKKFGGDSGDDPDWFKLTIKGVDAQGHYTGDVDFYLADFRFEDNSKDYIVKSWEWVDLTALGNVVKLEFSLTSSDNDPTYGMNTPAYFCLDNLNAKAPHDHAPIVKNQIADIVTGENAEKRVIDLFSVFEDEDGDDLSFRVAANTNQQLVDASIDKGELTLLFTPAKRGEATVTIEATANGKTVTTSFKVTVEAATAMDEAGITTINVYPNPCGNQLNIDGGDELIQSVKVIDLAGQVVLIKQPNAAKVQLNTGALKSGVYIVTIEINNKFLHKRVIRR
ncbi:DUF4465 domain-containing protein [Marinilabiliaceae bacterium JC017]|nr:DUF4465 domain-containing protein [Marinilabiliaceae bacterium JC017]